MGGGPHLGYGLSGKFTSTNAEQSAHFTSADSHFRTADYGINFIAGVELSRHILADVNYDIGLGNLSHTDRAKINNKVLGFSVGFLF